METEKKPDSPLARAAYEAYGKTTDFKNYQGLPMPTFDELPVPIRQAWVNAAHAAYEAYEASIAAFEHVTKAVANAKV